jgi:lysophospholipase L1-like esterase
MRRWVWVLVAGAVGVAVLLAVRPWASAEDEAPDVAVLGDSLVYLAENGHDEDEDLVDHQFVTDDLESAGFTGWVEAHIGGNHHILKRMVDDLPSPPPEVLVIGIGSNDAGAYDTETVVDALLASADRSGAGCAAFITVAETEPWQLDVNGSALNDALVEATAGRADRIIADWAQAVAEHPDFVGGDGVHQTPAGTAAYRELIVESAERCAATLDDR